MTLFPFSRAPIRSLLAFLVTALSMVSAAERPNILWVTSEDHGPEMGCYGDRLARTPNIDALAAKGMIFHRAWSVHPVCAPARTVIVSGLYGHSSGALHMRSMVPLPVETTLFPQLLRASGYYCSNHVKEDYNVPKTERTWDDSSAEGHWRKRKPGQPFFAVFNSTKSHESQIRTRPHQAITDPAKVRVPAYHPDTPEVRQDWAQYYDKVSEADADAGVRLRELEADGLAEDTIVFYFGDHGSGMPRSKRWPSNSGLHVPMVVYFPPKWRHLAPKEYQPGSRSYRLVSFVDLAPTVLSIAGLFPPATMQGHSFAGQFQAPLQPFIFGGRGRMDERYDGVRSVTDGRFVYLRNFYPHVSQAQRVMYQFETPTTRIWKERFDAGKATEAQSIFWRVPKAPEELYDLTSDRDEVRNLANVPEHRASLEKLRNALRAHIEKVRDVCLLPEGEMHARAAGGSPYDIARDETKYPFQRIYTAADVASRLEESALPQLRTWMRDSDSAVRYWATLGIFMRGAEAVQREQTLLREALSDASPFVRIVAAEALATHGAASDLEPALAALREAAPPEKNGVFAGMAALTAVEALGPKAAPLHEFVRGVRTDAGWPHARFNSYIPRLIENIVGPVAGSDTPTQKGKGKGKGKTKKKAENG